jgi:hypothetical protein
VLLETSGAIDVRLVPPAVHKIVDLKAPASGESDRNDLRNLESMNANDELKFVLGSRATGSVPEGRRGGGLVRIRTRCGPSWSLARWAG